MEREIKFRAWDGENMIDEFSVQSNGDGCLYGGEIEEYPIMQYTGIKDCKGTEIYEGDVNQDFGFVFWNADEASFCWKFPPGEVQQMGEEDKWCSIIGNIFESPELIK